MILRRTFLTTGTPQTEAKRWYVLQNLRQDAAVIISDVGGTRTEEKLNLAARIQTAT